MTDYAYSANDDDPFTANWQGVFNARRQTVLLTPSAGKPANVKDFIGSLALDPRVNTPLDGNLLLASHASSSGWLEIALDGTTAESITFERLRDARDNRTILIRQSILPPRPDGGVAQTYFHVRGCEVGKSADFVQLLQAALGGQINVTAPLYLSGAAAWSCSSFPRRGKLPGAYFEHMTYEFAQYYLGNAEQALPSRQQLIQDFQNNPNHKFIDSTTVPAAQWDKWIPKPLPKKGDTGEKKFRFSIAFDPAWGIKPNGGDFEDARQFLFNADQPITRTVSGGPDSTSSPATRRNFMKGVLSNEPAYQAGYRAATGLPPHYERYGFATLDDFMAAFDWVFEVEQWISRRYIYAVKIPITKPALRSNWSAISALSRNSMNPPIGVSLSPSPFRQ